MTTGTDTSTAEKAERRRWVRWRTARRVTAVVLWWVAWIATIDLASVAPWLIGERNDHGTLTIEKNLHTDSAVGVLAGVAALVLLAIVWGLWSERVDYRWFDGFLILVPVYNMFWSARIVWRLTYRISPAPVRAWPPATERPDRPQWPRFRRPFSDVEPLA